jgi:hypothetical protein
LIRQLSSSRQFGWHKVASTFSNFEFQSPELLTNLLYCVRSITVNNIRQSLLVGSEVWISPADERSCTGPTWSSWPLKQEISEER